MNRLHLLVTGASFAALLAACPKDSPLTTDGGAGDNGGTVDGRADLGPSDTGGEGGPGAGGGSGLDLPRCLQDLLQACPARGGCVQQNGALPQICYDSGVRVNYTISGTCMSTGRSVAEVTSADGTPCYSLETSNVFPQHACEDGNYTWRTPAGQVVATGTFEYGAGTYIRIQCEATGEMTMCDPSNCPVNFPFGNCASGLCP
jgi:hypothetical protein